MTHRDRKRTHVCVICRNYFQASRRDARYCSHACRQVAYRQRRRRRRSVFAWDNPSRDPWDGIGFV